MGTSLTATGVQFPDNSVQTAPALTGFRNKIINGKMAISQRGTSFSGATLPNGAYTLDRFKWYYVGGALEVIQTINYPNTDFVYSMRARVTTAKPSLATTDHINLEYDIEGYDAFELIGNTFTISFWVRSTKVGLYSVILSTLTVAHSYVSTYTINNADTWEKKTITITGGLNSAYAWGSTNDIGMRLRFSLASGTTYQTSTLNTWLTGQFLGVTEQVNFFDTLNNMFYITGIQVERGSVATAFEQRPYQVELALCQRYFCNNTATNGNAVTGYNSTSGSIYVDITFPIPMRASPSVTLGITSNINANSAAVNVVTQLGIRVYSSIISTGAGYSVFTYAANAEL